MTRPPRYRPKKLTKAQRAIVPTLMDALVQSEARTSEQCEERLREGRDG